MPPLVFASLVLTVIACAGVTVALVHAAGWSLVAVSLVALLGSVALRLWARR